MSSAESSRVDDSADDLWTRWQSHRTEAAETPEAPALPVRPVPANDALPPIVPPRHAAVRPMTPSVERDSNYVAASREIIEALEQGERPTPPASTSGHPWLRATDRAPAEPASRLQKATEPADLPIRSGRNPVQDRSTRRAPSPTDLGSESTDVVFAERLAARRLVGLLTFLMLAATGTAAYLAYSDPQSFTLGIAGLLLLVSLVLYGIRASSTPARLAIRAGQLEVVRGTQREVFDLTSRYTRIEVVGRPGRRGWKVLFGRFGRSPLVVDSSMVDPKAFTEALERLRPRDPA